MMALLGDRAWQEGDARARSDELEDEIDLCAAGGDGRSELSSPVSGQDQLVERRLVPREDERGFGQHPKRDGTAGRRGMMTRQERDERLRAQRLRLEVFGQRMGDDGEVEVGAA